MPAQQPVSVCVAVVDDDAKLRRSFTRLLRAAGMHPVAYGSAEALLVDTIHPRFDCLVLDVQLPGMSGPELQEHLNALGSRTPIIFITAHDDPRSRQRAIAGGCAAYFGKLDAGGDVLAAIQAAVDRSA